MSPSPVAIRKPRVAVVFGGRSSEHAISCITAGSVLNAIDRDVYDVAAIGICADGRWVLESDDTSRLVLKGAELPAVDGTRPAVSLMRSQGHTDLVVTESGQPPRTIGELDVVFPVLHGPWGEDGTIQGMLEMSGVRYVGAGVLASAVGMDKDYMKTILKAAGLPVTSGIVLTRRQWLADRDAALERVRGVGLPAFAKPARAGSSMGISKIHTSAEIAEALQAAFEHDPKVLIERSMEGARELECGVLGGIDGVPQTTRLGELRVGGGHEFYDFEAKYLPDQQTEIDIPAEVEPELEARVREMAVRAFEAISGEGLARVDFFLMPDGALVINELNTMPGFTPTSMYPQLWAAAGLTYSQLVDRLIQLALQRETGLR